MPDTPQAQTPGEAASVEAARQAVIFAFGIAGAIVLLWMSERQHEHMAATLGLGGSEGRMRRAQQSADRWDKLARWFFIHRAFGPAREAHKRAEKARAAYEAERL